MGLPVLALATLAAPLMAQGPLADAHASLVAGDLDSVVLSITTGAIAVDARDEAGYTLLHIAAQRGNLDAVRALLARGADPMLRGNDGKSPTALAANSEIRAELVAAEADRSAAARADDVK